MVRLDGGAFLMGSEAPEALPQDGEGPVRKVTLDAFFVSRYTVTNRQFAEFIARTNYRTSAERFGWSYVFQAHVSPANAGPRVPATPWWVRVNGADWKHPEGPDSSVANRDDHPVVHVSRIDAQAYCDWAGVRLATEAEWECAARGGLEQKIYPWGDELMPEGRHRCNIWQGTFPHADLGEDGYSAPAPVATFEPNGYGLFNMVGNVWEWCADFFSYDWRRDASPVNPVGPPDGTRSVIRGGSFLCHASFCFRYRNSARSSNELESSTSNMGFRTARDVDGGGD